MCAGLYGPPVL